MVRVTMVVVEVGYKASHMATCTDVPLSKVRLQTLSPDGKWNTRSIRDSQKFSHIRGWFMKKKIVIK